jgi:hypothetical protein
MAYTFETLDEGQIILFTAGEDFNLKADGARYVQGLLELSQAGPDRIIAISDMRNISLDFDDLMASSTLARNDDTKAFLSNPKLIKSLVVINSRVMELLVKGLSSATFGSLDLPVFQTVEEALNAARDMLFGQSKAN